MAIGFLDIGSEIGDLEGGLARSSDSLVMILTCPECATGYFVDDAQIGEGGRKVRCAACGARWTAMPAGPIELKTDEEGAIGRPVAPAVETTPLIGDDLPRAFRTRAEEEKRMRRAAVNGAAWAAVGVGVVVVLGALALFRESVVRAWPQSASAYAAVGLPVNPVGLLIENVHAEPSLQQGLPVLVISGVIRNVVDRTVTSPPLRISLFNSQGKRVAGQIDAVANANVPPGETRHFVTTLFNPPFSAHDLAIDFAVGAKPDTVVANGPGGAIAPTPLTLRGPADEPPAFSNAAAAGSPVAAVPPASNAPAPSNAAATVTVQ